MKALITAKAFIAEKQMKNNLDEPIEWTTESTTDLPYDALGEAVGLALNAAWKCGIDPATTEGFHIRVEFGVGDDS